MSAASDDANLASIVERITAECFLGGRHVEHRFVIIDRRDKEIDTLAGAASPELAGELATWAFMDRVGQIGIYVGSVGGIGGVYAGAIICQRDEPAA